MGAVNTPLYDLIEVTGINAFQTYTTGMGNLLGFVDTATYTDGDADNSTTQIAELNDQDGGNAGTLTIDGVDYNVQLYAPNGAGNDVTIVADQGTFNLGGDGFASQIVMMMVAPVGGGAARYFFAIDDSVGDLTNISSIQTRGVDWDPAGNDVKINLDQNNNLTVCFASGTRIETPDGPRPVEDIAEGDLVMTLDRGPMPVLWRHSRHHVGLRAGASRHLYPVRIRRDALQAGIPDRDLLVSPQHRIMVASRIADRMFGTRELLIPAVKLTRMSGISRETACDSVTYHHILLADHAILLANGAPTESFFPETQALRMVPSAERARLKATLTGPMRPARRILDGGPFLRDFIQRHIKNRKPLLDGQRPMESRPAGPRLVTLEGVRLA